MLHVAVSNPNLEKSQQKKKKLGAGSWDETCPSANQPCRSGFSRRRDAPEGLCFPGGIAASISELASAHLRRKFTPGADLAKDGHWCKQ